MKFDGRTLFFIKFYEIKSYYTLLYFLYILQRISILSTRARCCDGDI